MRLRTVCAAGLLVSALIGCVPPEQQRDLNLRLQKAEREREGTRESLTNERAQTVALKEQLKESERQTAFAEAEINNLKQRLVEIQTQRDELLAMLEGRTAEPLQRPSVAASPLPAETDQALEAFAAKFQQRVWYERGRGAVSFANDQLFAPGSDEVRADANAALYELAELVARTLPEDFEVVIVGHTDDTPISKPETLARHPSNWHLSVHRAIAVRDALEKAGVPAARLGVMGYGQYRPAGTDRARNRRVEVFLIRKGDVRSFAPVTAPGR